MLRILEIMRTEVFWATFAGVAAVLSLLAVIVVDQYRHPKIYSEERVKEEGERNVSDS